MVDESNSVIFQDDNRKILQVGVKDSDGEECTFSNKVKLYVQMNAPDGQISCVTLDITHSGFMVICDACCNGTNHTYIALPVFTWSEDNSSCKIAFTCANNKNHVNTYDCVVTAIIKQAATYKDMGITEYTATYGEYKDVKEVTDIPATGIPAKGKVIDDTNSNGTYKVTSIAKNAFEGNKYVTTIKLGNNITTIGANAFYNCKKLKNVTIGSKYYKKVVVKVPKKKLKSYKTMFKKKGLNSKAKVKKN